MSTLFLTWPSRMTGAMPCWPSCQKIEGSRRNAPTFHLASAPKVCRRVVWLPARPGVPVGSNPPLGSMPEFRLPLLPPSYSA